ncbi:6990_t:CDS:2, partial [Racocetra fulgida]
KLVSELISYKSGDTLDFNYDTSIITPLMWWDVARSIYIHVKELAKLLFAIVPSQASCELNLDRLESIAKVHSFYLSQINSELKFYEQNISEEDMRRNAIDETMYMIIADEVDDIDDNLESNNNNDFTQIQSYNENLEIEKFVDFTNSIFGGMLIIENPNLRAVIE